MIPSYYDPPNRLEGSVPMRGDDPRHESMFSYVTPEARVRADHPLRPIRRMTDAALERLSPRFERLYSTRGRPSIPPEQLLRALLLQMLYSIRSERLLVEEFQQSWKDRRIELASGLPESDLRAALRRRAGRRRVPSVGDRSGRDRERR